MMNLLSICTSILNSVFLNTYLYLASYLYFFWQKCPYFKPVVRMGLAWMTAKSCAWCRIMNSCGQKSAACMCKPFILILLPLFTTVFTFSSKFQYDFIMITFLLSNQVLFMQSDWCNDKILMNLLLVFVIKLQQKSNRHFQQELKTVWFMSPCMV